MLFTKDTYFTRLCVNGSIFKSIAPRQRPPCSLDYLPQLFDDLEPDDLLMKSDDKSGFSNHLMSPLRFFYPRSIYFKTYRYNPYIIYNFHNRSESNSIFSARPPIRSILVPLFGIVGPFPSGRCRRHLFTRWATVLQATSLTHMG